MQKYSLIFAVVAASLLWGPVGTAQDNPNNSPQDACAQAISNLEGGKDVDGQDLAQGDKLGHSTSIAFLKACNIKVDSTKGPDYVKDNHCSSVCTATKCPCTSMADARKNTVLGAMKLATAVREWHSESSEGENEAGRDPSCATKELVMTGGTELGHSTKGTQTHYNGYKLDFGLKTPANKCISSYLYSKWEFDGFRISKGDVLINQISDGTVTVKKEKDETETKIKGFCLNGSVLKYLPASGGDSVTYATLDKHDGVRMVAGDADAVLEQKPQHWDITFRGPSINPSGRSNPISPKIESCGKTK